MKIILSGIILLPFLSIAMGRPPSKNITDRILQLKLEEWKQEEKFPGQVEFPLMKWYKEWYSQYEAHLNEYARELPKPVITGGLTYFMSLQDIINTVTMKFKQLCEQDKVLTKDQFKKLDQRKWLPKGNNLTRLWGAEYLKEKFSGSMQFNVPEYIIVADDLSDITVTIQWGDFPIIATVNGTIYAQKIEGTFLPKGLRILEEEYGYTDYSGDNFIKAPNGTIYAIDTELKSFYDEKPSSIYQPYKLVGGAIEFCTYLRNRFKLLYTVDTSSTSIHLSVR